MKSRKAAMDELLRIADAVTKVVLAHYEASSFSVELKGPNDPVTTADKEANEALLQALQLSFPGVPIVAVTANALHGDAERCRVAGMDGHVGKPFDRAGLLGAVERWGRRAA